MTTAINVNRQSVLHTERDISYDDFTSGTAKALIYLKPGTRILRGFVDVTTAWNSSSSDSLTIGDTDGSDDVDRYLGATDVQATGYTSFGARTTNTTGVPSQVISATEALTATVTSSGTGLTAGAGKVVIEYVEDARVTEFHTYRG